ncbi:hypothetical protein ACILE9_04030 [Capnocytophaga cynodegmi]|uniref:hypothetical protein n=1 Tax=Capnocytophaga cynodegmi TaxID=28189 RepID=UPI0037D94D58
MRNIILIVTGFLFFSCENIDLSKYGEIFPVGYLTSENEVVYTPQKDIYKVEEIIEISLSFSSTLLDENDKKVHIQEVAKNIPEKIIVEFPYRWKEDSSIVHIVLNGNKLESLGRITFIYNKDKDRYILSDKLALVFHKKGIYLLSDILNFTDFRLSRQVFLSVNRLVSKQKIAIEE